MTLRSAPPLRILSCCALALMAGCQRAQPALPDFADLVDRVSPTVVNISAVPASPQDSDAGDADQDRSTPDWLKKFLEQHKNDGGSSEGQDQDQSPGATPGDRSDNDQGDGDGAPLDEEQSLGSGFILSSDGYILTNQHVVSDAKEVVVRLSDHRQFPAQVVGSDARSDIALLKIAATGLPAVKLADMKKVRVGEWVMAIGSPFGFDYSVTAGIISAKGRNLDTEQYVPFIQTDAAINPGNSGGPLFNLKGEVVGVNSQIYSQTGGFMGVAFAIPIDVAAKVARELKEHGHVTRGWLGVVVQAVDDRKLAKSFGLAKPEGALIAKVLPDSPAAQAGLRVGDVILKYNGTELVSSRALPPLVGDSTPGDTVALELMRDGRIVTVKVEVGTLDNQDQALDRVQPGASPAPELVPRHERNESHSGGPLGLELQDLSDEERKRANVVAGGVRVLAVGPGPGRDAGVERGDIILSIAGQEVDSVARCAEVAGRLTPGISVPMLVQRQGAPLFLALQTPPAGSR
ncbi:MAG: Do family serine endopeptidase [Nevskia sp.]|nr:Do family serine endopeptidase [Nevskia sp.]